MNPLTRILASLVASGISIAGRAFMQAYQQAVHNAKRAGSAEKAAEQLKQTSIFSKKMPEVEARQVLNISDVVTRQEVEDQFERLFTANDVEKGGSFYLQSKVYRARESVLEAMGETVDVPALLMDKEAIESSQTNKPSEEKEQEQKNKS